MGITGGIFCFLAVCIGLFGTTQPLPIALPLYFCALGGFLTGAIYICASIIRDAIEVAAERATADAAKIEATLSSQAKPTV